MSRETRKDPTAPKQPVVEGKQGTKPTEGTGPKVAVGGLEGSEELRDQGHPAKTSKRKDDSR